MLFEPAEKVVCPNLTLDSSPPWHEPGVCFRNSAVGGVHLMSDLDVAKEQIAYLKVWLGILVITDISVFGWLISNIETAMAPLLWAAVIAVVGLTIGILLLHRRIKGYIESLKGL
jgi:hypothetical protein